MIPAVRMRVVREAIVRGGRYVRAVSDRLLLRSAVKWVLIAVAVFVGSWTGAYLATQIRFPEIGAASLFPPYAVLAAALILTPVRTWWLWVLASAAANFRPHFTLEGVTTFVLVAEAANVSRALIAAWGVRVFSQRVGLFDSLRNALVFLAFAGVIGPAAGAVIGAADVVGHGRSPSFADVWQAWFLGNMLTGLTLLPLILIACTNMREWLGGKVQFSLPRVIEAAVVGVALVAVALFVFDSEQARTLGAAAVYLPLPLMIWAAVRFGPAGFASSLALVTGLTIAGALRGSGPFIEQSPGDNLLQIQYFLISLSVPLLLLTVIMRESSRTAAELSMSQAQYRDVVETQTEMVCRFLPDTTLTFVNEAYCRFFGRPREKLIGTKFLDLLPAASRSGAISHLSKVVAGRESAEWDHEVLLPNGEVGWHHWTDHPMHGPDGEVVEFQSIGRDITDRKRAEDALQESEEIHRQTLANISDAVFITSPAGSFTYICPNVNVIFGYSRTEVAKLGNITRILGNGVYDPHELEKAEEIPNIDRKIVDKNGRAHDLLVNVKRISIKGGTTLFTCRDITDRKRAEEAIRNLAHAQRLAVMGELTAMIAHEVNQPLGAILNNAEAASLLLESDDPPVQDLRQILADIRSDDHRAGESISRIRALLRKREMQEVTLDLNEVISDVLHLVAADAMQRGVDIHRAFAPDLPPARGDRVHLQQVLLNLIVNGMDAMEDTPPTSKSLTIRTGRHADGDLEVSISDCGSGIPPDRLPQLLESYFTTKKEGMGLGLSIARSIITAHRGRIWAENNPHEGATFHFTVPPVVQ